MKFDFPNIEKRLPTVENVLSRTTEAEIFRHFFGRDYIIGKMYKSPLRKDDSNPSFNIYVRGNNLRYKDFGHSEGSCFDFVKRLRNTDFKGALSIINSEMNLSLRDGIVKYNSYQSMVVRETKRYTRARIRCWSDYDREYWKQYKISSETLDYFQIRAAQEIWTRKQGQSWQRIWVNQADNPIYVFVIDEFVVRKGEISFLPEPGLKAYRPLQTEEYGRDSTYKWFTGISGNYMQGLKQLPPSGEVLFITSSLKDVATLYQVGIPAIAPNAENSHIPDDLVENLKSRFNHIYVNYDSDETGVRASQKFTVEHELLYWNVPKHYNAKDVSDLVKKAGVETLINELKKKKVL